MKKTFLIIMYLGVLVLTMSACLNDDDIPKQVNESEVISDVTLVITDSEQHRQSYTYTDPKYRSEDYEAPEINLNKNQIYDVTVHFYNKSNPDDVEDVTDEVIDERNDHFVEYKFYDIALNFERTDNTETTDDKGVKIGLSTQWEPGETGTGAVQVALIHKPKTKQTSPPEGEHTGGETDVQVTYDLCVE